LIAAFFSERSFTATDFQSSARFVAFDAHLSLSTASASAFVKAEFVFSRVSIRSCLVRGGGLRLQGGLRAQSLVLTLVLTLPFPAQQDIHGVFLNPFCWLRI
jgi:hypothetical protein